MTKPARMVGVAVVAALVVAIPALASGHGALVGSQSAAAPTTNVAYCVAVGATGATSSHVVARRHRRIECVWCRGATARSGSTGPAGAASWCRPRPCPLVGGLPRRRCGPPIMCGAGPAVTTGRVMPGAIVVCPCRILPTGATGARRPARFCSPIPCVGASGATGATGPRLLCPCVMGAAMCVPRPCPLTARAAGAAILCNPCQGSGATGSGGAKEPKGATICIPPPVRCLRPATGATGSTSCPQTPCTGPSGIGGTTGPHGPTVWCGPRPPCGPPVRAANGTPLPGHAIVCPLVGRRVAATVSA